MKNADRSTFFVYTLAPFAFCAAAACSQSRAQEPKASGGAREIAARELSGTFENKPFKLGKAIASVIADDRGEQIVVTFAPAGVEFGCGLRSPETYIGASAPTAAGSYAVGSTQLKDLQNGMRPRASVVFTKLGDPIRALIASQALVRIDSVSKTEVRGGLSAHADDGPSLYEVSGEFTAEICNR